MQTEAEKQLAELVSMPTITQDTTANDMALDYIEDYLKKRGMFTRRDRFDGECGTLLASTRPDNILTPTILLSAHVDVVAADESMFTLRTEGDKLIGRGTYDMKFAIAGYMELVDSLKGHLAEYDFGILIVTDEEMVDRGSLRLLEAGLRPQICVLPDATAPNYDIEVLTKGYWRLKLMAEGKKAHGGRPWEGESASFKLIQALHELKQHFEGQNIESDSLNIGVIHGGDAYNMVPSTMWAGLDIRYTSDENLRQKEKLIDDLCEKYGLTLKIITKVLPVPTDHTHPLIKQYIKSVQSVTGKKPKPFMSCAGSDAPYFVKFGINCIISCCKGSGHHTDDEWIDRASFKQFVPILRHYLEKTAKISPNRTTKHVDKAKALV